VKTATRQRGIAFALVAALLFGASAPFAKLLLSDIAPQLLAGLLYAGSGAGLAVAWLLRGARATQTRESPLSRKDVPWLGGAIAFGGIAAPVLLMIGLARTPASATSLLLNLEGVFTALLAWFVFHENFDRRIALGMLAILSGGVILSWQGAVVWGGIGGPLAVAGACLCWGIDNNLTQKVSASDPLQIAMYKGLAAGTVNTAIALALGATLPPIARVGAAAGLGFLSYGVSLVLFVLALRMLGTARTGAYFSTAPFIGAVLSIAVFHERPSAALIAAAVLMGAGVWLHVTEVHKHKHAHEAMEHAHAHVHDEHHQHQHGPNDPPVTDPRPHSHPHRHEPVTHSHPHYPDIHHRHSHEP
jgi:drug/metabolite transporter (DMT)-like permease